MLDEALKSELLRRARHAAAKVLGLPEGRRELPGPSGVLAEPGAAFVTWKREGRLRGCIGSIEAWIEQKRRGAHGLSAKRGSGGRWGRSGR